MCPFLLYNAVVSESSAMKSWSEFKAFSRNLCSSLLSCIPYALSVPRVTCFSSPFMYFIILSLESSHVLWASGLNANMAGFITGMNLSSTTLPLYSVTELSLVKYFRHSEPTRINQSYLSVSITISTSRFSTFFIVGSEHN